MTYLPIVIDGLGILIVLGLAGFVYLYLFKGKLPARKTISYEERTVPSSEAAELLKTKGNKQTKINADGTITVRVMNISAPAPKSAPVQKKPNPIRLGRNIPIEFTRVKEKIEEDIDKKDIRRITLLKGKTGKRSILITRKTGIPGLPYAMHYVDQARLYDDKQLRFDIMWAEPIDPDTGRPEFSQELENLWVDGIMSQGTEIAASFGQFRITKTMAILMGLSFAGFALIVMGGNATFHFTPTTQVHWLPALPTFAK